MTRFVRFVHQGTPHYGVVEGATISVIDPHPFGRWDPTGETVELAGLKLLAPVIPTKVVCVGRNYADHAAEMGGDVPAEPLLFLKPSSAVIGPGEAIQYPTELTGEVHHEAELAVVVGRTLQRGTPEQAAAAILGCTAANDVTARDLQRRDDQWTRAKGFDTFLPLGPSIATDLDLSDTRVACRVDGVVRQDGSTRDLVVDVPTLLSTISQVMTLLPTDVVLTGTPAGVGPILPGDVVEVEVAGVGSLVNPVVERPPGGVADLLQ